MTFMRIFVLVILAFAIDALRWKNCGKLYEILPTVENNQLNIFVNTIFQPAKADAFSAGQCFTDTNFWQITFKSQADQKKHTANATKHHMATWYKIQVPFLSEAVDKERCRHEETGRQLIP